MVGLEGKDGFGRDINMALCLHPEAYRGLFAYPMNWQAVKNIICSRSDSLGISKIISWHDGHWLPPISFDP